MASPTTPSDIPDIEILALMQEGKSLSDILKELLFLRRWKESQLAAQKEDSQRMERLLTRLCGNCRGTATRWIRHENGSTDDLPVELFHTILKYSLPPDSLLDPTSSRGPRSPWRRVLQTKWHFLQVNKRWNSLVLPFLYEEVVFRHATQVHAFARTLRENLTLPLLVKKIVVDCPIAAGFREDVYVDLAYILTLCTGLRTLVFTDMPFTMEDDQRRVMLHPFPHILSAAVKTLSPNLQSLEQWPQGCTPHFILPISSIMACTRLVSLTLNLDNPLSLESFTLPCLEELDLSQEWDVRTASDHSQRFANWMLPRVKRMILPMIADIHGQILLNSGKSVEYLEFRNHLEMGLRPSRGGVYPYCIYLHLCPALRHLVFPAGRAENYWRMVDQLPAHPTLEFIDIWVFDPAWETRREFIQLRGDRKLAPAIRWKNVRLLDRALHAIRQLPRLFPPDIPEDELPSYHNIPALSITHASWGVYRSDMDTFFPEGGDTEEGDEDPSDSDSSSDDSDSTYLDFGTPSDDTISESDDGEEGETAAPL